MPVYNPSAGDLAETIETMLAQTESADIVIVDDGSRLPITQMLTPRDDVTILRLDRNSGITAALNRGLDHITGAGYEFVARMDCGDTCAPDRIAKQLAYMDSHPDTDLLGAFADIVDEHGNHLFFEGTSGGRPAIGRKLQDNAAFKHPTFFFRTSCVQELGDYSTHFPHAEDYEFMCRVYAKGNIDCLDDVLVTYEKNSSSISSKNRSTQLWSRLRIQLKYLKLTGVSAYIGVARTFVTLLVPATMWARFSQFYWTHIGKRGLATKAQ